MEENKFWIILWLIVLTGVLALIAGITTYNVRHDEYRKEIIENMIKNNYSPDIVKNYINSKN